ncbi:NAD-dependent succinate-semialdehyde dehydrogenase [Paenarthrobacter sp. NPDC090520]|uniref:NAD-dependent succinate-semialdehyde dehydrogenase n=1 Tax=Paenarthrobacter sp. NPDC090520 TaxID=3364382 RepID=UPI0037FF3306
MFGSVTGTVYRAINPATGLVERTFPSATDADVQAVLHQSEQAYRSWAQRPAQERALTLARVGQIFRERADELALIATNEVGKPLSQAKAEVEFSAQIFEYYAETGPGMLVEGQVPGITGATAVVQKRPLGPLLGVMPWNYPYYQVARFVAPNLLLGNTVLLKHAESCPGSAQAIQDVFAEADVPNGVYSNVFATHEQVASVIADSRVQGVSYTGSERAGAVIGGLAGANLKKAVLELGGSDAYIVLDTVDVRESARDAWAARMENTGQACNSNKRIIVMEDIHDAFVDELIELAKDLQPGDPSREEPGTFAPMASRAAAQQLAEQLQDAVRKGATLQVGGELATDSTAFFSPAVLTGVTPAMRAYHEELFGPVLVVYKVGNDDEAVVLANDTKYGLGGAVFSQDPERAKQVATDLVTGMVFANASSAEMPQLPFGGVKSSGYGRELGPLGVLEFSNQRLVYTAI